MTESKKYINLPPNPSSFIESIRFFGYSMKTAVADIVDNQAVQKALKRRFSEADHFSTQSWGTDFLDSLI